MKRRFRKAAISVCLTGVATAALATHDGVSRAENAENNNAPGVLVESRVEGLAFRSLSRLPKAPASAQERSGCEHLLLKSPQSAAGREAAAAGWAVTAEGKIGAYEAVSFAGRLEQGTSGTCGLTEGNVAVFYGSDLVAVAYAPASSKLTIGRVEPFENTGLRIWDGDMAPRPLADIRVEAGNRLVIAPLAPEERFCDGQSVVPNIYHLPITRARALLQQRGWSPADQGDASRRSDAREAALAQQGVREVDSCSGTGFGFCSYSYSQSRSALQVATIGDGEDPTVSNYSVSCLAANAAPMASATRFGHGAATGNDPSQMLEVKPGLDWRSHAERRDRDRIDQINSAWDQALMSARNAGHEADIRAEGALLHPRAGQAGAHPPGGFYRCRTVKLGTSRPELLAFIRYPSFRCRVWENFDITYFEKITGSQRPAGVIFRDGSIRSVMIGAEALGDEKGYPRYATDGERDQIAVVEKIDEGRWRIVFPFPVKESLLNVIELIDQEHAELMDQERARQR